MRISELFETEEDDKKVIKGKFGKSAPRSDLEIPKGYKSFFTKPVGKSSYAIYGVKADGSEHKISTSSSKELADALAKEYNSGGTAGTGIKSEPLIKAFGSDEIGILHDIGIKFHEKPSYWEDLNHSPKISEIQLQKAKRELEKHGYKLKEYESLDLWRHDPKSPLVSPHTIPKEEMFLVVMGDGSRYLVDRTGAKTYFRMWVKIS